MKLPGETLIRWLRLTALAIALLLVMTGLAACGSSAAGVPPAEEESIEAAVEDYYTRSADAPAYVATVEQVEGDWARVSIAPEGVDTGGQPDLFFLRRAPAAGAIAATPSLAGQTGMESLEDTQVGWTIVLGPQAQYSAAELETAGVPESLRP